MIKFNSVNSLKTTLSCDYMQILSEDKFIEYVKFFRDDKIEKILN